jgi:glycosyltransferase involved in cell wall biosynthesis
MSILFSIIVPTYNRAHLIANAVNSVLKQAYSSFELIIVDDGSTDKTESVINDIQSQNANAKIFYFKKENGERAAARNYGLKQAKGRYVNFFDSDDELYAIHLAEAANVINGKPNIEVFHLGYEIKSASGKLISKSPEYQSPLLKQLIKGNFLSCNGVFIRKDIALENQFNEDRRLSAAEDWELWLRLSAKYPIHYINTITSVIINHDERSVLQADKGKLLTRMELFMDSINQNLQVRDYYKNDLYKLAASCYSYISLHLALVKHSRKESIKYLLKALRVTPAFVFQRRFLAIIKHLL